MDKLVEGRAEVVTPEGIPGLVRGEICYIREIPNMRGHVVILRNNKPSLVGYHLDRFRLLTEDE